MSNSIRLTVGLFCVVSLCAGCASAPAARFSKISSNEVMKPYDGSRGDRRSLDFDQQANWSAYDRFILDPVEIYNGPEAKFERVERAQLDELAGAIYQEFGSVLADRFSPATGPSSKTLRVRVILTGASDSKRFMGTAMKFDLAGGVYNSVQAVRGKRGAFTGAVSYVVEIYDSQSNKLLKAYAETQYPNALNPAATAKELGAPKAGVRNGAKTLSKVFERR